MNQAFYGKTAQEVQDFLQARYQEKVDSGLRAGVSVMELFEWLGQPFNLNSSRSETKYFFSENQIPWISRQGLGLVPISGSVENSEQSKELIWSGNPKATTRKNQKIEEIVNEMSHQVGSFQNKIQAIVLVHQQTMQALLAA